MNVALIFACALLAAPAASERKLNANRVINANALVRKMMATYQSAQAIEETSEAKVKEYGKADYIQSTTLRFKGPNLIYLASEDPSIGTYQSFCNGKTITVYTGRHNTYTKRNSPIGLPKTLTKLAAAGELILGVSVVQMLSPLSFMSGKAMPQECRNFQYVREEMLEGNKVIVVTGQANLAWLQTMGAPQQTVLDRREVTLWIDANRFLLRKAACDLLWRFKKVSASQNVSTVTGGFKFVEVHRATRMNPPLRDEDFFFVPPTGAVEQFQDRK